ncbi:Rossmann fold nucleotide-binding protein [Geotalea daltonii FRC-32]|uniref:AMP nucleosidase n=1 Tax=Geotalea daltonii (strain DSM 22248 / JCM 15807 / FRC-32) TaxID=316067 RepID=B9M5E1_GEODF|nr:TIGR00730 family Rossman fold protein [Geotalea daltonii]ACM19896.1 Rossmann fold nucleotide-binding protein [Geotalea daltonii FRC-32]
MQLSFNRTNKEIDEAIDSLIGKAGGVHHQELVREMIISALKAGQDTDYLADLKLLSNTMKEMRYTNKVFSPYRHRTKVTIFGSARTEPQEEAYQKCVRFSRLLADKGYMIITGGGPGIMQAGNEGAGSESSFAVNIRLPFEQAPNPFMLANPRLITYKYFFNRKVAFVKEADAIAVFPGGFGTLDEAMEVFTLIQTGKTSPKPLVLIDDDDGYWEQWFIFIKERMLGRGFISAEDFSIFTITRSEKEAVKVIEDFYRNYHSLRFVNRRLIIRLNKELSRANIDELEKEFPELHNSGTKIISTAPLQEEQDEPDLLDLPRIALQFDHQHYGLLMAFIGRINMF